MMIVHPQDATEHRTPNALMKTVAAPSIGAREIAVWTVEMAAGSEGPAHDTDHEQIWHVLEGSLEATVADRACTATAGDTLILPAGTVRQVRSPEGVRALVATRAGALAITEEQGARPLPWAA